MSTRKNWEIYETQVKVFVRDDWKCVVCGRPGNQCAHILPQDKLHIAKYGTEIIHHPENLLTTCSLKCNSKVEINGRSQPLRAEKHAQKIKALLNKEKP